jgi:hypothetical protein
MMILQVYINKMVEDEKCQSQQRSTTNNPTTKSKGWFSIIFLVFQGYTTTDTVLNEKPKTKNNSLPGVHVLYFIL